MSGDNRPVTVLGALGEGSVLGPISQHRWPGVNEALDVGEKCHRSILYAAQHGQNNNNNNDKMVDLNSTKSNFEMMTVPANITIATL